MNFHYTRTAAAVLCALAYATAGAADQGSADSDLLDTIEVRSDKPTPAYSPVDTEALSPGRESADALRDLLGVSGSRMGGHGTDVSIRGQSQTRINVLLDGAYVHGGCPNRMDPPTSYAATGNYEEVIVIRGAQTLEYGGGGSGGTILFERVTERFDADEVLRGDVDAGYRGNGNVAEFGVDIAGGGEAGFGRFIGSYTDAHNYDDGNGDDVRAAYTERSGALILGYTPTAATRAEISVERQETRDLLFPGAGMDSPLADNDTLRLKFDSADLGGAIANLKVEAYRSEIDHVMDNYTLRTLTAPARMRAPSTSDTIGGRIVAEIDSGYGRWKLGVDTQRNARDAARFNDSAGLLNSVLWPGVEIDQSGVFAELTHALDRDNRVIGGVRYDYVTSDAADADVDPPGGALSPNALYAIYYDGAQADKVTDHNVGALLRFEHDLAGGAGTVYAGLSRSVRTPDATERFLASNGMTPSMRWVGNPDLESEKHHQAEVGLRLHSGRWDVEASAFYNDVSDYVLRDRFTAAGDNATIYRNIDATLVGGEARVGYRFAPNWRGEIGAAYVRADNDSDDRPIAQTPPLEGIASLEYTRERWIAGARVRAAAQQTRVDTGSSTGIAGQGLDVGKTSGWAVLDLYASFEVSDSVTVDIGVDNLFDKSYAQHLNRANAFDPTQVQVNEPGRSGWLKVSASF
ncbi:MAG: TonB-dependent copper receptor [Gammaproteobacteria bacterium]|nr:TonB-dependent copper receptor [Gammaproteobacteria bacterium]